MMINSDALNALEEEIRPMLRTAGLAGDAERYLKASAALRIKLLRQEADRAISEAKLAITPTGAANAG
jgi:hypothetical protein